jgi:pseudaminic acid biosynthesis-associated methylase
VPIIAPVTESETQRLEGLWAGTFGDAYIERNADAGAGRVDFWRAVLDGLGVESVLEVGCNVGANLRWLVEIVGSVHGVDVSEHALEQARERFPGADLVCAQARSLPFEDRAFDLVFTTGVLIHLPDESLAEAMDEIVRCSARYVLCGEYFADPPEELLYRGETGALFKRNYGALYQRAFPELRLRREGFLSRDEGWDDLTWWLFEKS